MGTKASLPVRAEEAAVGPSSGSVSATSQSKEGGNLTPLDVKIVGALKELHNRHMQEHRECSDPFTRILLKFPEVKKAFNSVRATFESLDKEKKGYIVFGELARAFERLGAKFTKEEIEEVFQESDMTENGRLTFKEFLVCLAIAFVLHRIPSLEEEKLSIFYAPLSPKKADGASRSDSVLLFGEGNKLRMAFQFVVNAFLWFDIDGDGVINRDEMTARMRETMHAHSPTKKTSKGCRRSAKESSPTMTFSLEGTDSIHSIVSERRFNEMDWNHDGTIQFKEFLLAFESWVGVDEDKEVDDE